VELSFVITAIRKRWWLIVAGAILGSMPGLLVQSVPPPTYSSTAVLLISPPTDSFVAAPDRHVENQVEIITSRATAEEVATRLGGDVTADEVASAVTVTQRVDTDIVAITAEAADRQQAQAIAQTYVEVYLDGQRLRADASTAPDLARINERLAAVNAELSAVNAEIGALVRPWLARAEAGTATVGIPPIQVLAPELTARQQLLLEEFTRLQALATDLEGAARSRATSEIVQPASLPSPPPLPERSDPILFVGFFVGAMLGVAAAIVWARFSTRVLDETAVAEILGTPVLGHLPAHRSLARDLVGAFAGLPRSLEPVLHRLVVRAEAMAPIDSPLRVAVVGTHRGAGCTTVATLLAARFAAEQAQVLLVDLDARDPHITRLFRAAGDGGIPKVLATGPDRSPAPGPRQPRRPAPRLDVLTETRRPEVKVLGLGDNRVGTLRRSLVPGIIAAVEQRADVLVFDGGPLLEAASTVELCNQVDVVVLVVPLRQQRLPELSTVGRQLAEVHDRLIPLITSPRRSLGGRRRPRDPSPFDESANDVEVDEDTERSLRRSRQRDAELAPVDS
jgi:capsular polysaccharide biosynthesis protein/Mrp family chromosome partitioning ATPase